MKELFPTSRSNRGRAGGHMYLEQAEGYNAVVASEAGALQQ